MRVYKGFLSPEADGVFCVEVLGINVNAEGASIADAVDEAASGIADVTRILRADGVPVPSPVEPTDADLARGTLVVFQAALEGAYPLRAAVCAARKGAVS
ncbi:MAG: hypothetical protein AAF318_18555 [Pseudomonadota bacterium]